MKKVLLTMAVMLSAVMAMAQQFGKAGIALVPNADLVMACNSGKINASPMKAKLDALKSQYEEEFKKLAKDDDVSPAKLVEAAERMAKTLGFKKGEDHTKAIVVSVAFNGMFANMADEPDWAKMDFAAAVELARPIEFNPAVLAQAIGDLFAALGADPAKDYAVSPTMVKGTPCVTIEIKEDDMPACFRKIMICLVDSDVLLFAPEASAKAALDRKSARPAVDPFFASVKGDQFLALRMMPELSALITDAAGEENPALKALASARGFALTAFVDTKITLSLNSYQKQAAEATLLKTQLWDAQVQPLVGMLAPAAAQQFGNDFPCLSTIKGEAKGSVFGISIVFTEADIKAFVEAVKKELSKQNAGDGDDE